MDEELGAGHGAKVLADPRGIRNVLFWCEKTLPEDTILSVSELACKVSGSLGREERARVWICIRQQQALSDMS